MWGVNSVHEGRAEYCNSHMIVIHFIQLIQVYYILLSNLAVLPTVCTYMHGPGPNHQYNIN